MFYRPPLRTISLTLALLGAGAPALASEPEAPRYRQAQDIAYGVALYDYFQGNYFDALSTLMVAEQRGAIRVHADNAALIEGGISLGFGLSGRAATLFEQQLQQQSGDPETLARYRQVAWLKLAELNYRQQNWPRASAQLQKSGAADSSDLSINLALREGDFAAAEALLDSGSLPLARRLLGRINLAAALAREQRYGEAIAQYRRASALVEDAETPSRELRILNDKAHIGAGYAYALQQRFAEALEEFRHVRLRTAWADRALLGLGWSAINSGEYRAAIDALQFLLQQHGDSAEAREALVALPYSYEKLQRPQVALAAYRQAENRYRENISALAQLQQSVDTMSFAADAERGRPRFGWLEVADTPPLLQDNRRYLQNILQSDAYQLRLSDLRDLRQLARVIDDWRQQLPLFDQLIDARRQRRQSIIENYSSAQYDQQVEMAERQYRELETALARIERDRDGLALLAALDADDNEYAGLLALLQRAEGRYEKLAPHGKTRDDQRRALQRARGLLQWRAAQDYHDNLWQKRKGLQTLGEQLQAAGHQRRRVAQVVGRAPQLRQLQAGVAEARPQLSRQSRAIAAASAAIESSIRRDVIAELKRQQAQIQQYMAHSRLAIARLQDAAMQGAVMQDAAGQSPAPEAQAGGGDD